MFDPAEIARAGAFVSIDRDGMVDVQRGFVRPEDELPVAPEPDPEGEPKPDGESDDDAVGVATTAGGATSPTAMPMRIDSGDASGNGSAVQAGPAAAPGEPEEDGIKPLSDRLLSELTTHRTLALRHVLGERPDVAFLAALHALCLKLFYPYTQDTCLEIDLRQMAFTAQAPGLSETVPAKAIRVRHQGWAGALPREAGDLWDALAAADDDTRQRLFAHCISASVNGVHEAWNRRGKALAHAGRLAEAMHLDMAAAGWEPTVDLYLGRVSKARILQAVREGKGERAAERIAHLKKGEMAGQAQELLAGSGWLPEPLRTPGQAVTVAADTPEAEAETEQPGNIAPIEEADDQPAEDPAADATEDWQSAAD